MKLSRTSVGQTANTFAILDTNGTGLLPVQVEFDPGVTATYRILGRVSPEAPWREIKAAQTAGMLESMAYVPFLQLDVTAKTGTGGVNLWVAEA